MEPIHQRVTPPPGWYAVLLPRFRGWQADLENWRCELTDPADAVLVKGPVDVWYLTSDRIARAPDLQAARAYACALLDDLTVRMALSYAALPFAINGLEFVDHSGGRQMHHFIYVGLDAWIDENERARPAKKILRATPKLERVKLLLIQFRKSSEWREMYGTLELAELAVGKKEKLRTLLDGKRAQYDDLRAWTNLFRHETPDNEADEWTKAQAMPLLEEIVRVALANVAEPQNSKPSKTSSYLSRRNRTR